MRALVMYTPDSRMLKRQATELADELHWRGFDPQVDAASEGRDVGERDLVVVVFPAVPLGVRAVTLGGVERLLDSLTGLDRTAVGFLAISPAEVSHQLTCLRRHAERLGARWIATTSAAPGKPGITDLAAECMARIP